MKAAGLGCFGFILGAILGGVIGVALGFAWTSVFHTSDFEGYSGMLVFYSFMPIGIIAGGLMGAVGLALLATRSDEPPPIHQCVRPARLIEPAHYQCVLCACLAAPSPTATFASASSREWPAFISLPR